MGDAELRKTLICQFTMKTPRDIRNHNQRHDKQFEKNQRMSGCSSHRSSTAEKSVCSTALAWQRPAMFGISFCFNIVFGVLSISRVLRQKNVILVNTIGLSMLNNAGIFCLLREFVKNLRILRLLRLELF